MNDEQIKALFEEVLSELAKLEEGVISEFAYSRSDTEKAKSRLGSKLKKYRKRLNDLLKETGDRN